MKIPPSTDEFTISREEKNWVRDLARKQLEIAMLPVMAERTARWYRHNDLEPEWPLVTFESETCAQELLPPPVCASPAAHRMEHQIRRELLNHEVIGDDRVVPACYRIPYSQDMVLFGFPVRREYRDSALGIRLGFKEEHPLPELPPDPSALPPSRFGMRREEVLRWQSFVTDILGDILPVVLVNQIEGCITQHLVGLMGMEAMMLAMVDDPARFSLLAERVRDDLVSFFRWLEHENLLVPNSGNDLVNSGSFGFTRALRQRGDHGPTRIKDLWAHLDSQETVGVSPAMFHELFLPLYRQLASLFGRVAYGCCEPVEQLYEISLRRLPGLRKISVSPFCRDEPLMGEVLRGQPVIYHRKPSPNFLGTLTGWDADAWRAHILATVQAARGCRLEFSLRNIYTLYGHAERPAEAVRIVREVLAEHWQPAS